MNPTIHAPPPSEQYWRDRQWIHDNYAELSITYADMWIAVRDERVLAADPDLGVVHDAARKICAAPDIVFMMLYHGFGL